MKLNIFVILSILMVSVAGCRTAPIYNVNSAPVNTRANATLAEVGKTITQAGAGLGWQMRQVSPGVIEGRLNLRGRTAVVDIPYTTKTFSILHKETSGLRNEDGSIHKNYNGWIQNLEKAITAQLSAL